MSYLSRAEVVQRLAISGRKVSPNRVYEWVKVGVAVRGFPRRIKLKGTYLPTGLAISERDLADFLSDIEGAHAVANGEAKRLPKKYAAAMPETTPRLIRRCLPEEVGSFPMRHVGRDTRVS
jgi:hypothetical protein